MAYTVTNRQLIPLCSESVMFLCQIDGDTSGTVETGLRVIDYVELNAAEDSDTTVASTSLAAGTVTLTGTADAKYTMKCIGH